MNYVEPIRDLNIVNAIVSDLKDKPDKKYYILFCIGIYSGLRVSDILPLRVTDVRDKDEIRLYEKKTGKLRTYPIPAPLKRVLRAYCRGKKGHEYLIPNPRDGSHIKRGWAWAVIKNACERYHLHRVGTHTMRKTFGYHFYMKYGDVSMLMEIFNHSHESITLRYLGINKKIVDEAILGFNPFKL